MRDRSSTVICFGFVANRNGNKAHTMPRFKYLGCAAVASLILSWRCDPRVICMATVRLPTERITDWESFHEVCREVFGFPDFYGMNMDAWID